MLQNALYVIVAICIAFFAWLSQMIDSLCIHNKPDLYRASKFFRENRNVSDIVISLTTMPRRLQSQTMKKVVEHFLLQSTRAREIRLNIPWKLKKTGERYRIPAWLKKLPVTIVRCADYGPATKIIPTLQQYEAPTEKQQPILIYDDDALMPLDTIRTYQRLARAYPNSCLTCKGAVLKRVNGRVVPKYEAGFMYIADMHPTLKFLFEYILCDHTRTMKGRRPKKVDIVYGGAGYCIRAGMLDWRDLIQSLPKEGFFVDDIVISGTLAKNGISRLVFPQLKLPRITKETAMNYVSGFFCMPDLESLWTNVNHDSRNNDTMVRHYGRYWNA